MLHRGVIVAVVLNRLPGIRRGCARARTGTRTRTRTRSDHRRPSCDILQRSHRFRTVDLQRLQPVQPPGIQRVLGDPGLAVRL